MEVCWTEKDNTGRDAGNELIHGTYALIQFSILVSERNIEIWNLKFKKEHACEDT
jgi:hypothetical protein